MRSVPAAPCTHSCTHPVCGRPNPKWLPQTPHHPHPHPGQPHLPPPLPPPGPLCRHYRKVRKIDNFLGYNNVSLPPLSSKMMQEIAQYTAAHRRELPHLIWRDASPQHFPIDHGTCLRCVALRHAAAMLPSLETIVCAR